MTETAHNVFPAITAMSTPAAGSVVLGAIVIAAVVQKIMGGQSGEMAIQ